MCAYTFVVLSHFVCSVLGGSVSLCALLIFLPPHRIRLCVCVCARFALSLSAIDSLQTHTHTQACALAHTLTHIDDDGKRGTPRKWVEERVSEREKITSYINAQDDYSAVCMNDIQQSGGKHSLAFRSIRMTAVTMSC